MINNVALPDFKVDASKIPTVKIRSMHFQKFKAFEDAVFDFSDGNFCKPFICFYGPNGCGKSTILDSITILLTRFDGRDKKHLEVLLGKSVRHVDGVQRGIYGSDDFLITAQIQSSLGDYEIQINKSGFIKDHPQEIKDIIYRLCFYARFDQELHRFQLNRRRWPIFKDLFESVTGFEVEEIEGVFDESSDPVQADILRQYVLGFMVHKPDEIISHKECSAGERKIIKSFSTLLNKEYMPSIVCIDNAEMHVEAGRHIQLIDSIKRCFPNSQIFATTHSYQISKNFGDRSQLYDLRMLKASDVIKNEPWRLYISDEIKEAISKLNSMVTNKDQVKKLMTEGDSINKNCFESLDGNNIIRRSEGFLQSVSYFFIQDMINYYKR